MVRDGCIQIAIPPLSMNRFFGCVEICYAQMSPASVAVMDNLTACTDVQCAGGGGSLRTTQCHQTQCPTQYDAPRVMEAVPGVAAVAPAQVADSCVGNCGFAAPGGVIATWIAPCR